MLLDRSQAAQRLLARLWCKRLIDEPQARGALFRNELAHLLQHAVHLWRGQYGAHHRKGSTPAPTIDSSRAERARLLPRRHAEEQASLALVVQAQGHLSSVELEAVALLIVRELRVDQRDNVLNPARGVGA